MFEWVQKRLLSYANMIGSSTEGAFLKSLRYNKNSSGPKMEPCGTPTFRYTIFISTILMNLNVLQVVRKITLNPCVIPISNTM